MSYVLGWAAYGVWVENVMTLFVASVEAFAN
jgi:hypothetical protein